MSLSPNTLCKQIKIHFNSFIPDFISNYIKKIFFFCIQGDAKSIGVLDLIACCKLATGNPHNIFSHLYPSCSHRLLLFRSDGFDNVWVPDDDICIRVHSDASLTRIQVEDFSCVG